EEASHQVQEVSGGQLEVLLQPGEVVLHVQTQAAAQPQRTQRAQGHGASWWTRRHWNAEIGQERGVPDLPAQRGRRVQGLSPAAASLQQRRRLRLLRQRAPGRPPAPPPPAPPPAAPRTPVRLLRQPGR
ncbi:hypothetical protein CRUP_024025, partial [Coryphaenoides rupestris]